MFWTEKKKSRNYFPLLQYLTTATGQNSETRIITNIAILLMNFLLGCRSDSSSFINFSISILYDSIAENTTGITIMYNRAINFKIKIIVFIIFCFVFHSSIFS